MSKFNEDHTAAALKGIPIFRVNRLYSDKFLSPFHKGCYRFKFENGYGASIVEFTDLTWSGGQQYELAVLDLNGDICYTTPVGSDVERGNEYYMHELLCKIEALKVGDN